MVALTAEVSTQRKSAIIAGVSLCIMAIAASFSNGFVLGTLVVKNDAGVTFNNIASSAGLFNAGIFGWLIVFSCDILVAWTLYIYLYPINKNLSLAGALFRILYTATLGFAILNLFFISLLTSNAEFLLRFTNEQLQLAVMFLLDAFHFTWSVGLVVFGVHLMIISYLSFRAYIIPKIISLLLFISSLGYILISLFKTFLPQVERTIAVLEAAFIAPMIIGELGFGIWLLVKGGKSQ